MQSKHLRLDTPLSFLLSISKRLMTYLSISNFIKISKYNYVLYYLNNVFRPIEESMNYNQVGQEVKGRAHTYYQVLIDSRDCPYIVSFDTLFTYIGEADMMNIARLYMLNNVFSI